MDERFLVTSALGCLGAWTLRAGTITFEDAPPPFPEAFESRLRPGPATPIADGVRETTAEFRRAAARYDRRKSRREGTA